MTILYYNNICVYTLIHIADFIFLEPGGIIVKYLRDDLSLTCHHSSFDRSLWLANGSLLENASNPLNAFVEFVNTPPSFNYSEITINDMTEIVNGTQIGCFIETTTSSVFSNNITILLQGNIKFYIFYIHFYKSTLLIGKLKSVGNLKYEVYDNYLQITWSSPFALDQRYRNQIFYELAILNETSHKTNITNTHETNYEIYPTTSRLITCDDFSVTVTPKNKLGFGNNSTISIQSEGNYSMIYHQQK